MKRIINSMEDLNEAETNELNSLLYESSQENRVDGEELAAMFGFLTGAKISDDFRDLMVATMLELRLTSV